MKHFFSDILIRVAILNAVIFNWFVNIIDASNLSNFNLCDLYCL